MRFPFPGRCAVVAAAAVALAAPAAGAQDTTVTSYACYVPHSGTVYRIRLPDTRQACASGHVEFSWVDRGRMRLTGIEVRSAQADFAKADAFIAECPAGKGVINFSAVWQSGGTRVRTSRNYSFEERLAWYFVGDPDSVWNFQWLCVNADGLIGNY